MALEGEAVATLQVRRYLGKHGEWFVGHAERIGAAHASRDPGLRSEWQAVGMLLVPGGHLAC